MPTAACTHLSRFERVSLSLWSNSNDTDGIVVGPMTHISTLLIVMSR